MPKYDAIIIGSGPNGYAAAITLARKGLSVLIIEAYYLTGGGMRTSELTLPGFKHDVCSAVHPTGYSSPFFKTIPFEEYGLKWIFPPAAVAHPFDDGTALLLKPSYTETAAQMNSDEANYINYIKPFIESWDNLAPDLLGPLTVPKHPLLALRFGLSAVQSSVGFANRSFKEIKTKSLFTGIAAHSMIPLDSLFTASFGIVLQVLAHKVNWPFPKGGSVKIVEVLKNYFYSLGGKIITGWEIKNLDELPAAKAVLFDLSPRQILNIMGDKLPSVYSSQLRKYRYSSGIYKMDFALNSPVPWKAKECLQSATLHLGGTMGDILESEKMMWSGKYAEKPFVLAVQPSLFDDSRAPEGKHTFWAYCHVPNGSDKDISEKVINQIERFAPGFRDTIIAQNSITSVQLENYNKNMIGGDIMGGIQDWKQLFTRPVVKLNPYRIPVKGYYICSSSSPPGGGVHGMCGYHSALTAIKDLFN